MRYKINITKKQIKILNAVERYMESNPMAAELGWEYVGQNDDAQVEAIDLACKLADIYKEYA